MILSTSYYIIKVINVQNQALICVQGAELLGISRRAIQYKSKKYNIDSTQFKNWSRSYHMRQKFKSSQMIMVVSDLDE